MNCEPQVSLCYNLESIPKLHTRVCILHCSQYSLAEYAEHIHFGRHLQRNVLVAESTEPALEMKSALQAIRGVMIEQVGPSEFSLFR